MQYKKPLAAVSVVALAALAACGGGTSSSSTASNSNGSASPGGVDTQNLGNTGRAQDPNRPAPAAPIAGAQMGGTATILSTAGATTFDPTESYYTNTASIDSSLVTRSLTQYVYDPQTKGMTLIPDLATDLGTHNADYTSWSFTIRPGIKWEDGTAVTMDDIVFGIKRSFDRATFPGGADYSNQYFLNGDKYNGPYSDPNGDCGCLSVKDNTITIKMSKPFPDMPYWGAFPAMGPVPAAANTKPADYALHPMATGPYKFSSYQPGSSLKLVRNDQWDASTDPGRHNYIDGYNFTFDEKQAATVDTTILGDQGAGQTTLTYDDVAAADLDKAKASGNLILGGQPCTFFFSPDYRKITDKNVREALGWAYPYVATWLARGYIVGTTRIPGTMILPPGIPGRLNPAYDVLGNGGDKTDPQKAHDLLQQAGQLGYEIKFLYLSSDPAYVAEKDKIVSALEQAGFKATPVAVSDATRYAALRQSGSTDINVRAHGWCSDWPSGGSWMPPLFQTGSGSNLAFFSEPAVDKQMAAIQKMPIDQQPAAWGQLDKTIEEQYYPAVITGNGGVAMIHGSKVMNMNDDNVFGMPTWKDMWIQQ